MTKTRELAIDWLQYTADHILSFRRVIFCQDRLFFRICAAFEDLKKFNFDLIINVR